MKEEFEARIGLTITADEYADIEPLYANHPKSLDKDAFAKEWLKHGGTQWLLNQRQGRINVQKDTIAEQAKLIDDLYDTIEGLSEELKVAKRQMVDLQNSLQKVRELVV